MTIERNKTGQAIVQSMLELAENMGMEAIAEGIETNQEHGFVRSTKCRIGQGYLLGRPMTAEQAHSLLISQQECECNPDAAPGTINGSWHSIRWTVTHSPSY